MQQIKMCGRVRRAVFFLAAMLLLTGIFPSYAAAAPLQVNWYNGAAETEISVEKGVKFYLGDFVRIYSDTVSSTASLTKAAYRSSNGKVASINSKGYLNAKKTGQTDITVACQGKTLICHLTVEKKGTFEQNSAVTELKAAAKKLAKGMPKKLNAAKGFSLKKKKEDYLVDYGAVSAADLSYDGFLYENRRPSKDKADYKRSAKLAVPEAGRYLTAEALLRQFLLNNNPFAVTSKKKMRIASVTAGGKKGRILIRLAQKVSADQILAAQMAFSKQNSDINSKTKANFTMTIYDETDNRFYKGKPVLKKGSRQIEVQPMYYDGGVYRTAELVKGHVYLLESGMTWAGGTRVTVK